MGTTSYVIPKGSSDFWQNRLSQHDIPFTINQRFNETYIELTDPDGLQIEMVERETGFSNSWSTHEIKQDYAIKGFGGATLYSAHPNLTAALLEDIFGLEFVKYEAEHFRYKSEASIGNIIDINRSVPVRGLAGAGTVHHLAWRAKDEQELQEWKTLLEEKGHHPTEIKDRNYFKAIYFKEPGGILFEISTDPPGFTLDEPLNELGSKLMLPSWFEPRRQEFEEILPPLEN